MKTLREKISFILTALAYLLFHLGKSPDNGSIIKGTAMALMNTLPYEIGLTYLILVFIRRLTKGEWPPWDRVLRIFFTIGILFGLIYNLYVRGAMEQQRIEQEKVNVSRSVDDDNRKAQSYLA